MSNANKNIVITPATNTANDPQITINGTSTYNNYMTIRYDDAKNLVFESLQGTLFSIGDSFSGTLHSINDISGISHFDVDQYGTIRCSQFNGMLTVGLTAPYTIGDRADDKVQIKGNTYIDGDLKVDHVVAMGSTLSVSSQAVIGASAFDTSSPGASGTDKLQVIGNAFVSGSVKGNINLIADAPATNTTTGTAGEIRVDDQYIYVCTATDTWKRVELNLTTWS